MSSPGPLAEAASSDSDDRGPISLDEIERGIAAVFPPLSQGSRLASTVSFRESDFRRISRFLKKLKKDDWSLRPRTYAVLRMINRLDDMPVFVREGLYDISLPYTERTLPEEFRSIAARSKFIEIQSMVLFRQGIDLERGERRHGHFSVSGDTYFEPVELLGKGGFGEVDRVMSRLSRDEFARKRMQRGKTFRKDKEAISNFEHELTTLKRLSHHHLVKFVGSYTDPKYVCLIMSPVAESNLAQFLQASPLQKEKRALLRQSFGCLASAVFYLHDNKIRHKDIKPANILVYRDNILLTDFGTSLDWSEIGRSTTTNRPGTRTAAYCSPEVADWHPRNSSSDIWSLGCVFFEMYTVLRGESLDDMKVFFDNQGTGLRYVRGNLEAAKLWLAEVRQKPDSERDSEPVGWINAMIQEKPRDRPTALELLSRIKNCDGAETFSCSCCIDESDGSESSHHGSEMGDPIHIERAPDPHMPPPPPPPSQPLLDTQLDMNGSTAQPYHTPTRSPPPPPPHSSPSHASLKDSSTQSIQDFLAPLLPQFLSTSQDGQTGSRAKPIRSPSPKPLRPQGRPLTRSPVTRVSAIDSGAKPVQSFSSASPPPPPPLPLPSTSRASPIDPGAKPVQSFSSASPPPPPPLPLPSTSRASPIDPGAKPVQSFSSASPPPPPPLPLPSTSRASPIDLGAKPVQSFSSALLLPPPPLPLPSIFRASPIDLGAKPVQSFSSALLLPPPPLPLPSIFRASPIDLGAKPVQSFSSVPSPPPPPPPPLSSTSQVSQMDSMVKLMPGFFSAPPPPRPPPLPPTSRASQIDSREEPIQTHSSRPLRPLGRPLARSSAIRARPMASEAKTVQSFSSASPPLPPPLSRSSTPRDSPIDPEAEPTQKFPSTTPPLPPPPPLPSVSRANQRDSRSKSARTSSPMPPPPRRGPPPPFTTARVGAIDSKADPIQKFLSALPPPRPLLPSNPRISQMGSTADAAEKPSQYLLSSSVLLPLSSTSRAGQTDSKAKPIEKSSPYLLSSSVLPPPSSISLASRIDSTEKVVEKFSPYLLSSSVLPPHSPISPASQIDSRAKTVEKFPPYLLSALASPSLTSQAGQMDSKAKPIQNFLSTTPPPPPPPPPLPSASQAGRRHSRAKPIRTSSPRPLRLRRGPQPPRTTARVSTIDSEAELTRKFPSTTPPPPPPPPPSVSQASREDSREKPVRTSSPKPPPPQSRSLSPPLTARVSAIDSEAEPIQKSPSIPPPPPPSPTFQASQTVFGLDPTPGAAIVDHPTGQPQPEIQPKMPPLWMFIAKEPPRHRRGDRKT
ncbi:MAG: hypothetical protein M1813_006975 [Trichoglossum hirsutum]|nr:MAG: hypothetical protein M1813_006975 [Trichoglossum hirsutum]